MYSCPQWLPPPGELGQASLLYSSVCHPGLKNKIKLVLLNYLLSAKSRWFSLREKGILRICDQTLTQTDYRGVHAQMHVDADLHARPHTQKQINQRNSKVDSTLAERCLHTLVHKNETHTQWTRTHNKTHKPQSQTLVACQKSVISCLEDVNA